MKPKFLSGKSVVSLLAVFVMAFSAPFVFAGHINNATTDASRDAMDTTQNTQLDQSPDMTDETQGTGATANDESINPQTSEGEVRFRNAAGDIIVIQRDNLAEDPFASATMEDDDGQMTASTGSGVDEERMWSVGQTLLCTIVDENEEEVELRCELDDDQATTGSSVDETDSSMDEIRSTNQQSSSRVMNADQTTNTEIAQDTSVDQEMTVDQTEDTSTTGTDASEENVNRVVWWNPSTWF